MKEEKLLHRKKKIRDGLIKFPSCIFNIRFFILTCNILILQGWFVPSISKLFKIESIKHFINNGWRYYSQKMHITKQK
jgi:hypothetical protein